ncbi:MAG TPA: oligosaccharide flippase family protein [Solirubrobacteraceae bacterium]|jgi:O-antigen/teichoic acid export membrane protein|nr:oligosaccharide flippase family protein [Solirubrobacteraceae bacterium]
MTASRVDSPPVGPVAHRRRLAPPGEDLRHRTARGTIINGGFQVALAGLALVQRLVVAKLLLPAEYGLWSAVLMIVLTVLFLKNAGIGDKFIQQREHDQEREFQRAFTFDLTLALACVGLAVVAVPLLAIAYGNTRVIGLGLVLSLAIVGNSLQAPVWIHYREMDFARQRVLLSVDPCVTFVVTIALAIAGAGVWSLVAGATVGAWTGGLVALKLSPYRPRWRLERSAVRAYARFSWPLVFANGSGMFIAQGAVLAATRLVGLAGAGGIGVASSVSGFTDGVDGIITQALYPAVCAVRDRMELLEEAFVKSNRLALLWGLPFGVGVALFAPQLVHFVIGAKWSFATDVIAAFGLVAGFDQLGFNWTAFLRALDQTRPIAVIGAVNVIAFLAVAIPLMVLDGMQGFALGWLVIGITTLSTRTYYLKRLFPGFSMIRHSARAMLPCAPAVAAVVVARAIQGRPQTTGAALAELAGYVVIVIVASVACERALLREVLGYLRHRSATRPEFS